MARKTLVILTVLVMALAFAAGPAMAKWPSKPIQVIVPWPAANDPSTMIVTAMSKHMSKDLGVPVKIINKPGGGGVLGTFDLAKARPDGHTLGVISIGPMITQVLRGKTPYKNQDFKPLGLCWSSPFTMAARGDAPYNNLKELAEYGKKHELRLAHWGLGAVPTLIAMTVAEKGGFKWKETAYRKLNPLLIVKGDADVITFSVTGMMDYLESGKMKLLACMLPTRLPAFPKIPTVSEQGFGKGYSIWFGAFVPAKVPDDKASRLSKAFFDALQKPDVQKVAQRVGSIVHPTTAAQARKQMDDELASFGKIMKNLGIIK